MDRPLGPRQAPERHAAYEDIFGRRPIQHQQQQSRPPPPQAGYYPHQQQQQPQYAPPYPNNPTGYARPPPHFQQQLHPGPGPGPQYAHSQYAPSAYAPSPASQYAPPNSIRAASLRAPSLRPPYQAGVPAPPPDRPPDAAGLTPAQAYQAQVAWGRRSASPVPGGGGGPPALSVAIGGGEGLGINFDFEEGGSAGGLGSAGGGGVPEIEEEDEESELPWARREYLSHSFPLLVPCLLSLPLRGGYTMGMSASISHSAYCGNPLPPLLSPALCWHPRARHRVILPHSGSDAVRAYRALAPLCRHWGAHARQYFRSLSPLVRCFRAPTQRSAVATPVRPTVVCRYFLPCLRASTQI
ncbi:hypothetical protein DFH06DRAFT_1328647 [Mycena polygramma]|nr:hypothetical protein DFH06DRAFT_1328647 [Mycena polygramma]